VTLLLNHYIASRAKICLVSAFPDSVKDYPKMRINLPEIFLRSFENVGPGLGLEAQVLSPDFDVLRPP